MCIVQDDKTLSYTRQHVKVVHRTRRQDALLDALAQESGAAA